MATAGSTEEQMGGGVIGIDANGGIAEGESGQHAFDLCFGFVCPGVVGFREVIQMLHRTRLIKDREIHVELDNCFGASPRQDIKACLRWMNSAMMLNITRLMLF